MSLSALCTQHAVANKTRAVAAAAAAASLCFLISHPVYSERNCEGEIKIRTHSSQCGFLASSKVSSYRLYCRRERAMTRESDWHSSTSRARSIFSPQPLSELDQNHLLISQLQTPTLFESSYKWPTVQRKGTRREKRDANTLKST